MSFMVCKQVELRSILEILFRRGGCIAKNEGYHFMLLPSSDVVLEKSSSVMFPDTQLKFLLELLSSEMHNHFRGYLLVLTVSFKKNQALRQQKIQGNILHTIPLFVSTPLNR